MYLFSSISKNEFNAGPKAPADIEYFLKKEYANLRIRHLYVFTCRYSFIRKSVNAITKFFYFMYMCLIVRNKIVFLQFPIARNIFLRMLLKNNRSVIIIHDLDGLRTQNKKLLNSEVNTLNKANIIIAHNKSMKNELIKLGINGNKIIELGIFDYYVNVEIPVEKKVEIKNLEIDFAGNLSTSKVPWIKELSNRIIKYSINLYGIGYDGAINNQLKFCGAYEPSKLPSKFKGTLGLVWDGKINESDSNSTYKNYTKFNCPHKASCYLASNKPIIVWSKAAIADFVLENNIGYLIDNLYDINYLDISDLQMKINAASIIGERIRSGYYIKKAIKESLNKL